MKIVVERSALLKAMSHVQSVVERRNTIPILSNVLLRAEGETLTLTATDLELEIVETVQARIERAGGVTAPAQMLHDIVRKLRDGAEVEISEEPGAGRALVISGRSRFELPTLPREDFPAVATDPYDCEYTIRAGDLMRLFEKARFAISNEETRYYLNGVYLHVAERGGEKRLRAVSTDGHRLAQIECDLPEGAESAHSVIVPRKAVAEIGKLLEDPEAPVVVAVSEAKIRFTSGHAVLTSKVIDGNFPDYDRVIPKNNDRRMETDAKQFLEAVDRVATVSQEKSRAVKLSLDEDRLTLSVNSPDSGSAAEEIVVAYAHPAMEIGFNAKYLVEIAGQIDRENAVFFFADANAPTLVQEGDDSSAVYVVMPMRV